MPRYSVPSEDELPSGTERVLLPGGEDYVLRVLEISEKVRKDYEGVERPFHVVKVAVVKFADGTPLEDVKEQPVTNEPWLWKDLDPTRRGFKQSDGTPSLYRQFYLAINGIADMTARIPEGDTDELIGKELIGTLVIKNGRDGRPRNNITTFKTPSRRRGRNSTSADPTYASAVADLVGGGADLTTAAKEVFGDDLKTDSKADHDRYDDLPF